jgi:hypothetical protein
MTLSADSRYLHRAVMELARSVAASLRAAPKSERHVWASRAPGIAPSTHEPPPEAPDDTAAPLYAWLLRREEEAYWTLWADAAVLDPAAAYTSCRFRAGDCGYNTFHKVSGWPVWHDHSVGC